MATWGPTVIAATADDGTETVGDNTWTNYPPIMGDDSGINKHGGFRFPNVTVAQGSTVSSATLRFRAERLNGAATSVHLTVYGDDADDAAAWSSTSRPSQITQTTASVDWDPAAWVPNSYYTVTITGIVQEIVSRGGWASGNAMRFAVLDDSSTDSNFIRCYDYTDGGGANYNVQLTIDYTEAAAGQDLTGATLASGASLLAGTLAVGAVTVTGATLAAGSALLAATLARNQIALPVLDIADGNWISYPYGIPGNNVAMWMDLDETVPNDNNAIRSGATPSNDTYTCALSSLATPGAGDVIVRVRARYC
jgi:hypothetical protein